MQHVLFDYTGNDQMAVLCVNLMAYEAQRAEESLSLHNGSTTRQLSI